MALPGSETITYNDTGAWQFPVGTVFAKHFDLPVKGSGVKRLETRVLVHERSREVREERQGLEGASLRLLGRIFADVRRYESAQRRARKGRPTGRAR